VYGSIRWWRTQHPQPVIMGGAGSGLEPTMRKVFWFWFLNLVILMIFLIRERYALEAMREKCIPRTRSGGSMKNLGSVFAAYMIGWGIFFVYFITVARRTSALREEIERLKNSLNRSK